jgi:hypothetical protein
LKAVFVESEEAKKLYQARLVLVRPDGHVAWRADDAPGEEEALRIIDVVRGAGMRAAGEVREERHQVLTQET